MPTGYYVAANKNMLSLKHSFLLLSRQSPLKEIKSLHSLQCTLRNYSFYLMLLIVIIKTLNSFKHYLWDKKIKFLKDKKNA